MRFTFEAVLYEQGNIRLLEFAQVPEPRRALVTVLDETPIPHQTTGPTADSPMAEPLVVGHRIIDVAEISEIVDNADYVFVNFSRYHQPPYLHLTGTSADALRAWLTDQDAAELSPEQPRLQTQEIDAFEQLALAGESLDAAHVLRLIAEL